MVNTEVQSFAIPVIRYPMTATPVAALPQPLPKISVPVRTTTRCHSREWAVVGKVIFKLLQIGIFLAIILWPWETVE